MKRTKKETEIKAKTKTETETNTETKTKRSFREDWKMIVRGVKTWWKICPSILVYQIVAGTLDRLCPYFTLYLSALLLNELAGNRDPERLLVLAVTAVLGQFAISVMMRFLTGKRELWMAMSERRFNMYLFQLQNRMQYGYLEDPDVTLLREEIRTHTNVFGGGMMHICWNLHLLIGELFNLAASAAVTFSMFRTVSGEGLTGFLRFVNSPFLAAPFLAMLLLSCYLSGKSSRARIAGTQNALEGGLKLNTLLEALTDTDGDDVTIFNIRKVVKKLRKRQTEQEWPRKMERVGLKDDFLVDTLNWIIEVSVFIVTAAKVCIGTFGIGNLMLYKGSVERFIKSVGNLVRAAAGLCENN